MLGKDRALHRAIDLVRNASDASPHRLIPQAVVLPRSRIALHRTCSTTHLGLAGVLKEIAGRLADEDEAQVGTICRGAAGDRGLLHPERVVSATREVRSALEARPAEACRSANRTCEMGLRHAAARSQESFVFPLEELSRPTASPHEAPTYAAAGDSSADNRRFELDGADSMSPVSASPRTSQGRDRG